MKIKDTTVAAGLAIVCALLGVLGICADAQSGLDVSAILADGAKGQTQEQAPAQAQVQSRANDTAARAYGTKIGELAWQDDVDALSNKVAVVEEWAVGDDIALRIEDAGATNATFSVMYTNQVMYSSVQNNSSVLAEAKSYSDQAVAGLSSAVASTLSTLAWGDTTSSGAPSDADTLHIEKKSVAITGGGNYSYFDSQNGGYWIMTASLGNGMTMEALADAQDPTQPSTLSVYDSSGTKAWEVTSMSSLEIYAVAGDDMLAPKVDSSGVNDVITMIFPVNASEHPTCLYAPSLSVEFKEANATNWPLYIQSSVWTGSSGSYTNTVTCVGKPGAGFFKGKITRSGSTYTNYTSPIGISMIVIDGHKYSIAVETINGKKLMVLTEEY